RRTSPRTSTPRPSTRPGIASPRPRRATTAGRPPAEPLATSSGSGGGRRSDLDRLEAPGVSPGGVPPLLPLRDRDEGADRQRLLLPPRDREGAGTTAGRPALARVARRELREPDLLGPPPRRLGRRGGPRGGPPALARALRGPLLGPGSPIPEARLQDRHRGLPRVPGVARGDVG